MFNQPNKKKVRNFILLSNECKGNPCLRGQKYGTKILGEELYNIIPNDNHPK